MDLKIQGKTAIMAGGSDAAFEAAKPLFDVLGRNIVHVGPVGAGQVAKAANQMIVGLTIGAVAEALALARAAAILAISTTRWPSAARSRRRRHKPVTRSTTRVKRFLCSATS